MSELEVRKESNTFLTKLFFVMIGVIVISVSGLITLVLKKEATIIFWLGIVFVLMCILGCFVVFKHINNNIKEIRKL